MIVETLNQAFKEWAVICKALATGRQALIIRKGGIAEPGGDFELEHTRFWLFPTYMHQQRTGLQDEALPLLEQVEAEKPPTGVIRLSHFAEVTGVYRVRDLTAALLLSHLHLWSNDTVAKRFAYRVPELYVMPVRVWLAATSFDLPDTPDYQGCHSWVELDRELSTVGATAVLPAKQLEDLHRQLDMLLRPTALA
jgi:hypothetical protein